MKSEQQIRERLQYVLDTTPGIERESQALHERYIAEAQALRRALHKTEQEVWYAMMEARKLSMRALDMTVRAEARIVEDVLLWVLEREPRGARRDAE